MYHVRVSIIFLKSCDIFSNLSFCSLKLHSHQTPDQPPLILDQFLKLGRVWSGKKLPALIEESNYPRSTPAVPALYPWCTHAQIPLFPTYTRPSGWPIPALYDQPPTYSWCNYAHYAQYRTNPRFYFHSRPEMNNSSKRNANRQYYVLFSTQMRTWPILLIKSDLKWCIHLSRLTMTLRTVLVQYIEFFVVVCNFDDFVDRLVYFVGKNYRNYQVSFWLSH